MKFKTLTTEDFDIEERFLSPSMRKQKYDKHVVTQKEFGKHMTEEEYEKAADALANSKVDYKTILGYVAVDNKGQEAFIKYNTKTEEYVVYHRSPAGEPSAHSCARISCLRPVSRRLCGRAFRAVSGVSPRSAACWL